MMYPETSERIDYLINRARRGDWYARFELQVLRLFIIVLIAKSET